jgi:hypothetical protein
MGGITADGVYLGADVQALAIQPHIAAARAIMLNLTLIESQSSKAIQRLIERRVIRLAETGGQAAFAGCL